MLSDRNFRDVFVNWCPPLFEETDVVGIVLSVLMWPSDSDPPTLEHAIIANLRTNSLNMTLGSSTCRQFIDGLPSGQLLGGM